MELRATDFTRMNKILNNHAEWLDYNVSKVAETNAEKDALEYALTQGSETDGKENMNDDLFRTILKDMKLKLKMQHYKIMPSVSITPVIPEHDIKVSNDKQAGKRTCSS